MNRLLDNRTTFRTGARRERWCLGPGFTLIELLLAITLFSIIAVALFSSLASGIKVYRRGSFIGGEHSDLSRAFDIMGEDFRTALKIDEQYLALESRKISFYITREGQIYKVTYSWEKRENNLGLKRLEETYIESLQEEHQPGRDLLEDITEIDFDFGYFKKEMSGERSFRWQDKWDEEAMPKMVRMSIGLKSGQHDRMIYCPAGRMGEIKEEL